MRLRELELVSFALERERKEEGKENRKKRQMLQDLTLSITLFLLPPILQ